MILFDGKALRRLRLAKGLNENHLAAACGYQTYYPVRDWEDGKTEPSFTHTVILCRELGCSFADLGKRTEKAVAAG